MINMDFRITLLLVALALTLARVASASDLQLTQADLTADEKSKKPLLVDLWRPGDPGQRMNIRGRVTTVDGSPVEGVLIHIRQADGNGEYSPNYSTTIMTDARGRYQFGSVLPGQYYGTKHVHLWVNHDSYGSLSTEILFQGDPNLENPDAANAIFLEEATVNNETVLYGRFDIVLGTQ